MDAIPSPRDARILIAVRAARGFADGAVSLVLPGALAAAGYTPRQIGLLVALTLLGSAALALSTGLFAHRFARRHLLMVGAGLMVATGLALAAAPPWPVLLVVAFAGTVNPSPGDVTLLLPLEQAALADASRGAARTGLFARYNLAGALAGAAGALSTGLPAWLARSGFHPALPGERVAYLGYAAIGLASVAGYAALARDAPMPGARAPLARSRRVVLELSALFSLDSFGGGLVVQSILALWLFRRFGLSMETVASAFFGMGVLAAASQLAAARLAGLIGHVRTMVFTHLPANVLLFAAGLAPTAPSAVALLLARMSLSQMDVPARQAYVMGLVPPEERAAAATLTNVPRSLASSLGPVVAGALLARSNSGWPLLLAGMVKATYDLLLFARFRRLAPSGD